ncbi:uncharacterized protein MELLADRAFT_67125 [Melampsora larici-populina 98AG31]|uniref:F-box domain-containing protein n=1 Tax=Melampsora larici-populina (strain 98AG31 / pathotype 3-4-7) TaxID=747676 RepID=F4S1V9_MELLP|nr:uncharacterized protein MELLADRAFT_67125 [Melampsora larici-populina 98AG31]EGG01372.1 hypothetical protein MELLADRAFT_67125 [Melampsora larici-populina 98AG31]
MSNAPQQFSPSVRVKQLCPSSFLSTQTLTISQNAYNMSDQSSQPSIQSLPKELLTYVIELLVAQTEGPSDDAEWTSTISTQFISLSTIKELLHLRYVCKDWCETVTPVLLHSICVRSPTTLESILQNWRNLMIGPNLSPVKRLAFENLFEPKASRGEDMSEILDYPTISIHQATRLIEFLGRNLMELKFGDSYSMGFPPDMIKAIEQIKGLKTLTVEWLHRQPIEFDDGLESLPYLLNATPNLEALALRVGHLDVLTLQPQALSNLKYFLFTQLGTSTDALAHICKHIKNTVKVIEYDSTGHEADLESLYEPLKDTLEGLFTNRTPCDLPAPILDWNFPKLRVVRSLYWKANPDTPTPLWLQLPIFKNVRTLVTVYGSAQKNWANMLRSVAYDYRP